MSAPTFHYLARAVIERDGCYVLTREKGSAFTFLPGGHVEPGEPAVAALRREMREELEWDVEVGPFVGAVEHAWSDPRGRRHHELNLLFLVASAALAGTDLASKEPGLDAFWCKPSAFDRVDLRPEPVRGWLASGYFDDGPWWASTLDEGGDGWRPGFPWLEP